MNQRMPVEPVVRLSREALSRANAKGVMRISSPQREKRSYLGKLVEPLVLPPTDGPFHFTHRMSLLCDDITQRMPALAHIDMQRVLVTFVRCRNRRSWGLQAKLVPLRFRGGELVQLRRGHPYQVQQLFVGDIEVQYVLSFYLPRFLNQSFDEKMITVFHELYHIGPDFSGDIRRFEGSRSVHERSQRDYDEHMAQMARDYLALDPPRELYGFFHLSFADLETRYGEVVGVHIPAPKLIPVARAAARRAGP